jgi:hypothetical protein
LENVAENFGAGLQENQFRVNEVTIVYYLWVGLKDKAYTNPRWNKLRNITNVTSQQFPDKNARVNMFCQYTECMSGQHYFQHLLWHGRVLIGLSKGYYHCDNLCSFLYLLLRLPRCGIQHTGDRGCARKQEMVHPLLRLHDQNNPTLFSEQCHPLQTFFIFSLLHVHCCFVDTVWQVKILKT